jgi:hypothetical protein
MYIARPCKHLGDEVLRLPSRRKAVEFSLRKRYQDCTVEATITVKSAAGVRFMALDREELTSFANHATRLKTSLALSRLKF